MKFAIETNHHPLSWNTFEGLLVLLPHSLNANTVQSALANLPKTVQSRVTTVAKRDSFKFKAGSILVTDCEPFHRVAIAVIPKSNQTYFWLEWGRKVAGRSASGLKTLLCDCSFISELTPLAIDAIVSSCRTAEATLPQYHSKKRPPQIATHLTFLVSEPDREKSQQSAFMATNQAEANNLVRELALQSGNDLTPKTYVQKATALAKREGLSVEFMGINALTKIKAGAFLAVAQGNEHQDSGILKIVYSPKGKPTNHVAFVGKGITYDTGGQNLKTGNYMFGMHEDMTGSAVALALVNLAAKEKWPFKVTSFLAITENVLSPKSYRPNDIVTAYCGKTIEIVDTDAEGRMVLADTLSLAAKDSPDLVMDFATLTGSCIRALGTYFSGAYTNREKWHTKLKKAGFLSGERVWTFPVDPVFKRGIKSSVADLKQCRVTGGIDHLEAAYFLSQFVGKKQPWVHIDLSAAHNEGGLGHIGTKTTGFGVRFARSFVFSIFKTRVRFKDS